MNTARAQNVEIASSRCEGMSNHDEVALPITCKEMNRSVTGRDAAVAF